MKEFDLKLVDVIKIILNGVDSLFLAPVEREKLRKEFEKEFEQLLKNNANSRE